MVGRPTRRSVDSQTESLDIEPRKPSCREPSLYTQAGAASACLMAWHAGPTGVQDPGELSRGFSRNLGGLPSPAFPIESVRVSPNKKAPGPPGVRLELEGTKDKARRRYCPANAMSQRDGRQKSECPHSTSAAGEPSRGSPRRGRRAPCHRPLKGNAVEGIVPRLRVNATTTGSRTGDASLG